MSTHALTTMDENPYRAPQTWCYDASRAEHDDWSEREPRGSLHHELDPTGMRFREVASRSGLVIDGLRFVFDAIAWAPDLLHRSPAALFSAPEVCLAMVRYAEEIYDAAGIEALRDWGIVTGNDVGRFTSAMVLHGLLEPSRAENPEAFQGVGLLQRLAQ
jgi:hypothetical protein